VLCTWATIPPHHSMFFHPKTEPRTTSAAGRFRADCVHLQAMHSDLSSDLERFQLPTTSSGNSSTGQRQVAASQESPNKPYWMQAPKNKSPRSGHAHPGSWDNTSAGMQSNLRLNAIHRGSIAWFLNFMIITCPC
jgi:hypothetical protein